METYDPNAPVIINEKEVVMSENNRRKAKRTVRQLQVMRDASNLMFVIAQIEMRCPRSMRCLIDELERLSTELVRCIDLANEYRENRYELCTEAHSYIVAITIKLEIIQRLGTISKDTVKKVKRLCESVTSQVAGWRNSASSQGVSA